MRILKIELPHWSVRQYDSDLPDNLPPDEAENAVDEYGVAGSEAAGTKPPLSRYSPMDAEVPGCVQYDLVRHGKLKNPYGGTQAAVDAAWVAKSDWLYETEFDAPVGYEQYGTVILKLWGVDTFSEVWLNGVCLGKTANAYRSYGFEIEPAVLRPQHNCLKIRIRAHARMIQDKIEAAECLKRGNETEGLLGKSLIRRYQRSFFTNSSLLNVGTGVLGIGINRPVELYFYPSAYITDVFYSTITAGPQARGRVTVSLKNAGPGTQIKIALTEEDGTCVWDTAYEAGEDEREMEVLIANPKLWQPVGYGKAWLYTLKVTAVQDGEVTDEKTMQVGIRTVEIKERTESGKKTFYIAVNGQKIFVHGQNYIPFDYLKVYGIQKQYEAMFTLLENSHVNLVRVWGGGAVEDDSFFSECDKRGILIWHDLFLHSNVYPDYDPGFVQEFREETEGVLKTIRSHPCICLICGGNEQLEGWDEYGWQQELDHFYGSSLPMTEAPRLVQSLCPQLPYICNSPHGGKYCQSPATGDCHCWGNYYNAFKDPLFVSETCWTTESYSRPETLEKYMGLDMKDFEGTGWGGKWKKLTSLPLFNRRPYSSWFDVSSLRAYLHALEVEQARADYHALSQFRFTGPSNHGVIYWSFNKGGPLFQFGCVDYDGRPMMSYYVVKRLYEGISIFPYRDLWNVRVMLSNHMPSPADVKVEAFHLDQEGNVLQKFHQDIMCRSGEQLVALTLENLYSEIQDRTKETVFVRAEAGGRVVSEDLLLFCPYGELELVNKPFTASLENTGEREWELTIRSDGIIQMAEIESGIKIVCEDNYFPMMAGQEKKIKITALEDPDGNGRPRLHVGRLGDSRTLDLEM